ncbi:MAG: prolyl oligopeptidase family serine peptidase [Chlamydiota bacterium]|nr:prolyl oligopeptidase family serine peptidase [Chlamydiota bacterium]
MKKYFNLLVFVFCITSLYSFSEDDSKVGVKTLVFFDKSRDRPVITEVYYPSSRDLRNLEPTSNNFRIQELRNAPLPNREKKLPLIVFSHGHMGNRYQMEWLQNFLAANGYIVAVPDHFGDTSYLQRPEDSLKRWDRPKDISYVIDKILEDPLFKHHIDADKIGFVGFSFGGLTGVWLAGGVAKNYPEADLKASSKVELDRGINQDIIDKTDFSMGKKSYYDKRVKAGFLMAPAYGFAFTEDGLSAIDIPIMIIAGQADRVVSSENNARYFADNIKSSAVKILPGKVGHYTFLNSNDPDRGYVIPPGQKDHNSVDREKVHEKVADEAIRFFDKYLKGQTNSKK